MDEKRQIRFLIPPLFLIASLLWGVACDPTTSLQNLLGLQLGDMDMGNLLTLLAGGGIIAVTFGFLLGTLTVFVLRTAFRLFCGSYHEIVLSKDAFNKIWDRLSVDAADRITKNELYAGAAFDHEIMKQSKDVIHLWLLRRWNAFNVSASSAMALFVSVAVGYFFLNISFNWKWVLPVFLAFALFVWSAFVAHRDTMRMIEFQAKRP